MARIRTLKPDHGIHPKVGRLSDRAYRIWVAGLITQADDQGRLRYDADEIKAKVYSYHPRVRAAQVVEAVTELIERGLVVLYEREGRFYIELHDWSSHQSISHPMKSNLPAPEGSRTLQNALEASGTFHLDRIGEEGKGKNPPPPPSLEGAGGDPSSNGWGSPEALVALYNTLTPDECPAVKELTPGRVKKAKAYLAIFPREDFWRLVFAEFHRSAFLRGHKPSPGHEHFVADLDWLLSKGRTDQVENVAKVADGKYRDKGA